MVAKPVEEDEGKPDKVFLWRLDQLKRLGFEESVAAQLAEDRSVNVHTARTMREKGCSLALILEVVA